MENYRIIWRRGASLTSDDLAQCAALFSDHYGRWGSAAAAKRVGERVGLSPAQLPGYLKAPESWATLAYMGQSLIGYAFSQRLLIPQKGYVTWVTQFVVHSEHRRQGLGTRLLRSIWSVSDQYAWGLVTANPYAVRALQNATLRDCDPGQIRGRWSQLYEAAKPHLDYVAVAGPTLPNNSTALDTRFPVDHSDTNAALRELAASDSWRLGPLRETEEWAAFTFADQGYSKQAIHQVEKWIHDCDLTVRDAYNGMSLDSNHKWTAHTAHEIDAFLDRVRPSPCSLILDVGCGIGRHSIELAKRGFQVIGIDFVPGLIEAAQKTAESLNLKGAVEFLCDDVRDFCIPEKADHAICLYDVIGSYAADAENIRILKNISSNLKPGGSFLASVMNGELSAERAVRRAKGDLAEKLLDLPPSTIMQTSGNVFDPEYYLWDEQNEVAYRREQFAGDAIAPCELVVRDRRYTRRSLISLCEAAGFDVLESRAVKLGDWNHDQDALAGPAKEILIHCRNRPEFGSAREEQL